MTRAGRDLFGLAVLATAVLAFAPLVQQFPFPFGTPEIEDVTIVDVAVPPLAIAVATVASIQLLAALAGGGRRAPGGRAIPYLRPVIFGFVLALEVACIVRPARGGWWYGLGLWEDQVVLFVAALAGAPAFLFAALQLERRGGGSIALAAGAIMIARRVASMPESWMASTLISLGGPILMGLVVLRLLRVRRRDLARLGISVYAVHDLALAPLLLGVASVIAIESGIRGSGIADVLSYLAYDLYERPYLSLPGAAVTALGIVRVIRAGRANSARAAAIAWDRARRLRPEGTP